MSIVVPGDKALNIIRNATESVLFVSPYIKSNAIDQFLSTIPDGVRSIKCITRWLPEDIASGVCDSDIWERITIRGGELLVHPHLHAKYYRADDRCLVGSANLTKRGLGWSSPSNVELLVELPATFEGLAEWEARIINAAVPVKTELYDQITKQAAELKERGNVYQLPEIEPSGEGASSVRFWVPHCPVPEKLWDVYRGMSSDSMVTSAYEAAKKDLVALSPPPDLSKPLFNKYVAGILRQMPLIAEIDQLAQRGITDTQAHDFLDENLGDELNYQSKHTWRVLKDWLIHFFPETYRLEAEQEVLVKGTTILNP